MAVYSPIKEIELIDFLKNYNIGSLKKFEGILEGIENTNYKITTNNGIYILTIFEKRVQDKDLPFFISLKNHLINKNFYCPKPILDKNNKSINNIKNKSCVLISYLKGSKVNQITKEYCNQVGEILSLFHKHTGDFIKNRENNMSYSQWKVIYSKCRKSTNKEYGEVINVIEKELIYLKAKWPKNIPRGTIHADVFPDNVFFENKKFSGLIDFYFACQDFLSYDLALTINAWCFDHEDKIDFDKFSSIINGYQINRNLTNEEKNSLSILLRGAALRILLTRLHDKIYHSEGAFVEIKDPTEYLNKLKFHQNNNMADFIK